MNREDVLNAIAEAGWSVERFAVLIEKSARDEEREACAKICESIAMKHQTNEGTYSAGEKAGAFECMEAIRARGEPTIKDSLKVGKKLEYTTEPTWHPFSALVALKQFMMVAGSRAVLETFDIKYIDVRIDMRTGDVLLKEGNCLDRKPRYIVVREDGGSEK